MVRCMIRGGNNTRLNHIREKSNHVQTHQPHSRCLYHKVNTLPVLCCNLPEPCLAKNLNQNAFGSLSWLYFLSSDWIARFGSVDFIPSRLCFPDFSWIVQWTSRHPPVASIGIPHI